MKIYVKLLLFLLLAVYVSKKTPQSLTHEVARQSFEVYVAWKAVHDAKDIKTFANCALTQFLSPHT